MTLLQRTYRRFNRLYFSNSLPDDVKVTWHRYPKNSKICGESDSKVIWINDVHRRYFKVWAVTLLHEMCHVMTSEERKSHGPKWEKEIRRLMRIGAFYDYL